MRHLTVLSVLTLSLAFQAPAFQAAAQPTPQKPKFTRKSQGAASQQPKATGATAIVNSASFLSGISPGGLSTIFGYNLSDVSGVVVASSNPLPTELAHVSVLINGIYAPIFSVAYNGTQDQISVQVPYSTATGPSAAYVQVYNYGQLVANTTADSYDEDPGIFTYQGNYAVATLYPSFALIGPSFPAYPNDIIILYTTGLGPLNRNLSDGYGAPSDPLAYTVDPFDVYAAGQKCKVFFSGLTPGLVGLYQLNIQLPSSLPSGNIDLKIISPYADSNVATLPIH